MANEETKKPLVVDPANIKTITVDDHDSVGDGSGGTVPPQMADASVPPQMADASVPPQM